MPKFINPRIQLPEWLTAFMPDAIWRMPTGNKTLYLTFDDGPVPEVTEKVLAILRENEIEATFFCVGRNVEKHPAIFEKIKKAGHSIGNHTHNHEQGIKCSNKHYLRNIEKADKLIKSNMFRPPHGLLKRAQYKSIVRKYKLIMWDVISCDYDPKLSPETCYKNVVNHVQDGSIITFHDSIKAKNNVLEALPRIIKDLKNEGYEFRKIEFPRIYPIKKEKQTNHLTRDRFKKLLKGA